MAIISAHGEKPSQSTNTAPASPVYRAGNNILPPIQPPGPNSTLVPPLPGDRLLSERQAAVILGVSYETLKKWRHRKRSPRFVRFPDGTIRYRLSTLLKFIDDHTVED